MTDRKPRSKASDRIFRALLRLLPHDFRADYGREMAQLFSDQHRERRDAGAWGTAGLWLETLRDLLRTAPREHLAMLRQDCAYALRMMRREKTFAAAAILVLALGIGGNTAIFSAVHAVLLKPLPFPQPDRLYYLWGDNPRIGHETASLPDFADWRAQNDVFGDLAGIAPRNVTLADRGDAERVLGVRVSDSFFRVLGVRPAIGREFRGDEDRPGAPKVVMLADSLWRRRFDADPRIVGRSVTIEGVPFTVIGVMPPGFGFPSLRAGRVEAWTPLAMSPQSANRRGDFLMVVGRLKAGVTEERAAATMKAIGVRLEHQYPNTNTGWSIAIVSVHEQTVGRIRPALLAVWSAVGFLLLVACTNVANLLLARGAARRREMAIRAAIGAARSRLVRQSMTESVVFGGLGGLLGLTLAWWLIRLLVQFGPADIPRLRDAGLEPQVLLFTAVISLATGVVFGVIPASASGRKDLHGQLTEGGRHGESRSRARVANALVTVQMALSLVLLTGAGLMARSFTHLASVDPGFRTEGVLTARLSLPAAAYGNNDQRLLGFYADLIERVEALPGVSSAGATSSLYLTTTGPGINSFSIEGVPDPPPNEEPDAHVRVIAGDFHRTLSIPLLQGRTFAPSDAASSRPVVIVNRTFARRHFPNTNPLGHRVSYDGSAGKPIWREIVGVAGDARQDALDQAVYPEIQVPLAQSPVLSMTLVAASERDPSALAGPLQAQVRRLDTTVPLFDVQTMNAAVGDSIAPKRFIAWLMGAFALLALLLAACGLYGVVAYRVARSRQEIGIRVALGAGSNAIVRLIVARGMRAAVVGLAFGMPAAWLLTGYLRTLLFGVAPHDPVTFAAVAVLLLATCLVACCVPACRATRVDPVTALRME